MLKHFLQADPVLFAPNPDKPFIVMVDVSDDAMGQGSCKREKQVSDI